MRKRILSLLLVLALLVPSYAGFAFAANSVEDALGEVNIINGGKELNYLRVSGAIRSMLYTYYNYESSDGTIKEIPAYCVNPTVTGVPQTVSPGESIKYIANEKASDPKVVGIITYGYPHFSLAELGVDDKYQAYYATKIALWCYLLSNWDINTLTVNPNLTGADLAAAQKVLSAAKNIYMKGMWWSEMYEASLSTSYDREYAYPVTINGQAYKQQIITVTSRTWVIGSKVRVAFSDPDAVPSGTKIVNLNNQEISQITIDSSGDDGFSGKFKVLFPAGSISGQNGSVQFTFTADVHKYVVFYAVCAETDQYGNLQNYMCDTDPTVVQQLSAISKYNATDVQAELPDTALVIKKVESGTDTPLSGAVFEVKNPSGASMGTYSTDDAGQIVLPLSVSGNYTVTEITPPKFYLLSENPTQSVTVSYGNVSTVVFSNEAYGNLRIEKIDSNSGDTLYGAQVQIKHIETGAVYKGTTGTGGSCNFTNLKPGAYEIKELVAPNGYVLDTQVYTTNVLKGTSVTFTLKNEAKPGLRIVKYDAKTMTTLPDVTFEVYKDAELFGTYTTDQLGEIVLYNLEPGTYFVQEIAAPSSHVVNSTPQQIELYAGDNRIVQLVFFNQLKPGIHIKKVDSLTMEPLVNAIFRIEQVAGSNSNEYTTDEYGEIDLSGLDPGAYVVTEIEAPDGYLIDNNLRIIQINPGEDAEFVFTNTKKPSVVVQKYDANTGRYLPGATFRIAKIEDGSHYLDRVTDVNGQIKIDDLEPGIYSIRETAAPGGYVLNDQEYHVELFPGKTSTIIVNNEAKPNLLIIKTDAVTGARLPGATFTVNKADSSTLTTVTTDENGEAFLEGLDPGVYSVQEKSVPYGYLLDTKAQLITLFPNKTGVVQFQNYSKPALTVNKIDAVTKKPIQGAKFHVTYASNNTFSGEINDLGFYYSDENGRFILEDLLDGWYRVTEVEPAKGYVIKEPVSQEFFVKSGTSKTITFENTPISSIIIKKVDSGSGKGIYGATFLLYDENHNPIGEYMSDQHGYAYIDDDLTGGRYYLREIKAPDGYILDDDLKTVYVRHGSTSEIRWENTAIKGQIQIIKKSADDNPINALPAGTLLQGAVFEIYDKAGNTVDTIVTDKNGRAVSRLLPLSRYTVREVTAPPYYAVNETVMNAYLEFSGQIVTFEVLDKSVFTGVSIKKTGYYEVMPNQPLRYTFANIGNTSTVPLESFYWRDTLPVNAVRLEKIVTGTYNQPLSYKVVYKTNLSDYRTLADNLSTSKNYVLEARPVALRLAANEYVTEVMFVFGTVKAGFAQVETPYIYCQTLPYLMSGSSFANESDVGGLYNKQWIMAVSRWVTGVYGKPVPLPRTGY